LIPSDIVDAKAPDEIFNVLDVFLVGLGGRESFKKPLAIMNLANLSHKLINYLINYRKSYYVQFGQTRVVLIAVCEHSKAPVGRLEKPQSGLSLWYQSNGTAGSSGKPVTG
jgi:hypothetical protein